MKTDKKCRLNKLIGVLAEKGITQKNLAEMLTKRGYPITREHINNKINGRSKVFYEDMIIIADVLGVNPKDIFF